MHPAELRNVNLLITVHEILLTLPGFNRHTFVALPAIFAGKPAVSCSIFTVALFIVRHATFFAMENKTINGSP